MTRTARRIAILGLLLVAGCGGESQTLEGMVAVRYPNLTAMGSDVPAAVRRNFAELQAFFSSLKTLDPDGLQQDIDSVVFQRDRGNDRNPAAITPPTIASDGTAVDHTINTDGSANLSLDWSWTGSEADIDGWTVYMRASTSNAAYTIGTTPSEEQTFQLAADRRALIVRGVPADLHYTFGVRAYRVVDLVIAPNGLIESPVVQPSAAAEAPYQPATNVAFAGDITGTVGGTDADTVGTVTDSTSGNVTYYVGPSGDDNNVGSSGSPFATITKALSLIPHYINHNVTIALLDGTYTQSATVTGFDGTGAIYILSDSGTRDNVVITGNAGGPIEVTRSGVPVYISDMYLKADSNDYCIRFHRNSAMSSATNVRLGRKAGAGAPTYGFSVSQCSGKISNALDDATPANKVDYGLDCEYGVLFYNSATIGLTTKTNTGGIITSGVIDPT
jgi:hypothetical protein